MHQRGEGVVFCTRTTSSADTCLRSQVVVQIYIAQMFGSLVLSESSNDVYI